MLHHEREHAAVRVHGGRRWPTPPIARSRLQPRRPPAGPGEDLGVDLFERPGAGGHLVGARLLVIAHDRLLPVFLTSSRGSDRLFPSASRRWSYRLFAHLRAGLRIIQELSET